MSNLPKLTQDEQEMLTDIADIKMEVILSALSGTANSEKSAKELVEKAEQIANEVIELAYEFE